MKLRAIAIGAGAVVGLMVIAVGTMHAIARSRMHRAYPVAPEPITVGGDSATLARGEHLVRSVSACVGCHGPDLGGKVMIDAPMFAVVSASNLTPGNGGVAARYTTPTAWERAIRHGINAEGRSIAIMPTLHYHHLADEDLGAIVAYLQQLPPVDRVVKKFAAGPVSRGLLATNRLPFFQAMAIDHERPHRRPPAAGDTVALGEYLVQVGACQECHGPDLEGGPTPGAQPGDPPASNLTRRGLTLSRYDRESFLRAIRTGIRPSGAPVDTMMPWRQYRGMTDTELGAIWAYLYSRDSFRGLTPNPDPQP